MACAAMELLHNKSSETYGGFVYFTQQTSGFSRFLGSVRGVCFQSKKGHSMRQQVMSTIVS